VRSTRAAEAVAELGSLGGITRMKIPRSFIFGCLLVAGLVITSSCTTKRTVSGEHIYFTHTAAYDRKLRTLTLTEQQARERAVEFVRAERGADTGKIFIGDHMVIVGDCFVFSQPRKADVSLSGYYVDGHTGQVTRRSEGNITLPLDRK
jgi:hypothetical protein